VLSSDGKPRFYDEDIRGIRRHYAWLRKRLQKKGCMDKVKKMGDKEKRTVEDKLHKISRKIVEEAKETDSLIVLGELKGVREEDKGKKMNRIVSQWAYHKLTKMIEYKAKWEEILVVRVSEKNTSKKCHRCGSLDTSRPSQGRFKCHNCGLDHYNADLNGAKNILKRFSAYMVENGAEVDQPETQAFGHKVLRSDIQVDDLGSPFLTSKVS